MNNRPDDLAAAIQRLTRRVDAIETTLNLSQKAAAGRNRSQDAEIEFLKRTIAKKNRHLTRLGKGLIVIALLLLAWVFHYLEFSGSEIISLCCGLASVAVITDNQAVITKIINKYAGIKDDE